MSLKTTPLSLKCCQSYSASVMTAMLQNDENKITLCIQCSVTRCVKNAVYHCHKFSLPVAYLQSWWIAYSRGARQWNLGDTKNEKKKSLFRGKQMRT